MFIISLDQERKWFRYHHLFAELLKQKLNQKEPEFIKELHLRASNWFEQNNIYTFAIEHALEADHNNKAMQLINIVVENLWENGQYNTILKFANTLPEEYRLL